MKLSRLFAVPLMAGAMVLAGVTPAHAAVTDQACNYDFSTFNACLNFQYTGDQNVLTAHVGLDRYTSQSHAQEIINGGTQFRLQLWAYDGGGSSDRFIAEFTSLVPGWPAAGPGGLGVEMAANIYRGYLDEDSGEDEVYAKILYWDPLLGDQSYKTGTVHAEFAPIVEDPGGGGYLIVCP